MALPRVKPDNSLVAQAVELLDHHMPCFGSAYIKPGEFCEVDPDSIVMDRTPDDLSESLRGACLSAANYLKFVFDGQVEPAKAATPTPPWEG